MIDDDVVFNKKAHETEEALRFLRFSQHHKFYMCGSRFMNAKYGNDLIPIGPDTDHDFYTTYSASLLSMLIRAGFVDSHISYSPYRDNETVAIVSRGNVQVVLRKDALLYRRVLNSISADLFRNVLWKSSPLVVDRTKIVHVMNGLFDLARSL